MSRLLNRTFIFVSFAITLCSASPEVTATCRDGEPGHDECVPPVSSSLMQKTINKNRLRFDSASEAVPLLAAAETGGHETQLKSKSFKLSFASKSKRNQSQDMDCPMCGEQNDNASCMALCGNSCGEDGPKCTECVKENGCMDCLECARGQRDPSQAVMDCVNEKVGQDFPPEACGKNEDGITCSYDCIQALGDIQAQLDGSCCELATEWTPAYCRKQITGFNGDISRMIDTCSTQETPP